MPLSVDGWVGSENSFFFFLFFFDRIEKPVRKNGPPLILLLYFPIFNS